jgi:protein-tyrosine-phosphatase
VQELVRLLGEPQNLISYHLKRLRDVQLVSERRSAADGRDVYYSVDLERFRQLYFSAGEALHPYLAPANDRSDARDVQPDSQKDLPPARVLFLCTHNAARSQMAEAITRHLGDSMVEVYSAGSQPSHVHPIAIKVLQGMSIDVSEQRSKHMDEYKGQPFDYVITVCDRVREVCPLFPGNPEQLHWSFPDPAAVDGEQEQYAAFLHTAQQLMTRIRFLLAVVEKERRGGPKC